jgi:hypothetical protein
MVFIKLKKICIKISSAFTKSNRFSYPLFGAAVGNPAKRREMLSTRK